MFITPFAKKIAADKGVDYTSIDGSGPRGRIVAKDVLNSKPKQAESRDQAADRKPEAQSKTQQQAAPAGKFTDSPVSQMRKVIAERLQESKQNVPHYYVTMDIRMDKVMALRKTINEDLKEKISMNDFIIKAASLACKAVPEANSQWLGDKIRK